MTDRTSTNVNGFYPSCLCITAQ